MDRFEQFAALSALNESSIQSLARTPEPLGVTSNEGSVSDYQQVLKTNLASNYASTIDLIFRCTLRNSFETIIDVACGPGLYSQSLYRYLRPDRLIGVDLAAEMIQNARRNAGSLAESTKMNFQQLDARRLQSLGKHIADVVTFANAAHHLDSIEDVRQVLRGAEIVTRPDGIICLTDLARLKSETVVAKFEKLAGSEFIDLGMPYMYEDFCNSLRAAWLPDELMSAVPSDTRRNWFHLVPRGLGFFQALIGVPATQTDLFVRQNGALDFTGLLTSEESKVDFRMMQDQLRNSVCTAVKVDFRTGATAGGNARAVS